MKTKVNNYFVGDSADAESNAEAVHHVQQVAAGENSAEQFLFLWGGPLLVRRF